VKAQPAQIASVGVLVASNAIEPGRSITQQMVKWQSWPKDSVDSTFITSDTNPSIDQIVAGTVARAPIVSGEPLTNTKMVHADAAGFMSARLTPGMRAVSIGISTESGAGGFILPNDRVDVMLSAQVSESPKRYAANVLLHDVRVLAVDQTYTQDKDQKTVLAKTATLELSPQQAEMVIAASSTGTISLALRPLGEDGMKDVAMNQHKNITGAVSVIRYGVGHAGSIGRE
jgi:pilus assembly protein CpaB